MPRHDCQSLHLELARVLGQVAIMKIYKIVLYVAAVLVCALGALPASAQLFGDNPYVKKSREVVETAAKAGDVEAQFQWAARLFWDDLDGTGENTGLGIPEGLLEERIALASPWYEKSGANGYGDSYAMLAVILTSYNNENLDKEEATIYLEKGIALGSSLAKLNYAIWYIKDDVRGPTALEYLLDLEKEKNGDPVINLQINESLFEVYSYEMAGQERDLQKAVTYGKKCAYADAPSDYCQFLLARYYQNGWAGETDLDKAFALHKGAAVQGEMRSQWRLGMMYLNGEGTEKNDKLAFQWVEQSALQGYENGIISYAVMNAMGEGTEVNPEKAFEWYGKAAKNGSHHALRSIGYMIYQGDGVEENQALGVAAMIVAAEGDENAGKNLRLWFDDYDDNVQAYMREYALLIAQVRQQYGY